MMATSRPYAEEAIWGPIADRPAVLGFREAVGLHHCQLGNQSGYVGLVLFPKHKYRLVLVEAKRAADSRSAADVVGQLFKYYTHALALGHEGVKGLREGAAKWGGSQRPSRLLSLKQLFGARSLSEAQDQARKGQPLLPRDIGLVIALDAVAPKLEPRLFRALDALWEHHRLSIGVAVVDAAGPRWHRKLPSPDR
jgi:hypothetical protein